MTVEGARIQGFHFCSLGINEELSKGWFDTQLIFSLLYSLTSSYESQLVLIDRGSTVFLFIVLFALVRFVFCGRQLRVNEGTNSAIRLWDISGPAFARVK